MKKQVYQITAISVLILIAAGAAFYFDFYRPKVEIRNTASTLPDAVLIKPEDRAPLPVPPEILQNGNGVIVPILMYHHVGFVPAGADAIRAGLTVNPADFENQAKWLKEQGFQSVSLEDLYSHIEGTPINWPRKPVIFTFDDGYDDVFTNAVPILQKYGFIGAFAVITQFPGTISGTNTYATWQQIAAAKSVGMEIICHTQNHFDGSNAKFTADYIYQNLTGCQEDLKNHLGGAEPILIYPYGHSTDKYITQAKKAGFVMALTVHEGRIVNPDDLFHVPRVRVKPNESLEKFQETVIGSIPRTATGSPDLYGK